MTEHLSQAIADLERSRQGVRDAQARTRQTAFDLRRTLDDPSLSHHEKTIIEDELFGALEDIKKLEQVESDTNETMASIEQQRRDEENFGAVFLLIVGLIAFVVIAVAVSG